MLSDAYYDAGGFQDNFSYSGSQRSDSYSGSQRSDSYSGSQRCGYNNSSSRSHEYHGSFPNQDTSQRNRGNYGFIESTDAAHIQIRGNNSRSSLPFSNDPVTLLLSRLSTQMAEIESKINILYEERRPAKRINDDVEKQDLLNKLDDFQFESLLIASKVVNEIRFVTNRKAIID